MNKKNWIKVAYFLILLLIFSVFLYLLRLPVFRGFLTEIENKTFDIRQTITSKYKTPSKDIVIVDVDDQSYEYTINKYGSWPLPRAFWAEFINEVEKVNPKLIAFDILFMQRFTSDGNSDSKLIEAVNSNDNVFVSMNFDNYAKEVRTPPKLPDVLKNTIDNDFLIKKNPDITFINCRPILSEILNKSKNIGFINIKRDEDGIMRAALPFMYYDGSYYKNLAFAGALKYLGIQKNNFYLKDGGKLILNDERFIPLNDQGRAILNWYGGAYSFKYVPVWEVKEAFQRKDVKYLTENFKDKIIYVGVTASALSDIKTVPVAYMYPGVEVQATFFNNIIDNNFIMKSSVVFDFVIAILISVIIGLSIMYLKSPVKTTFLLISLYTLYFVVSIFVMYFFNVWIGLVMPFIFGILTFAACYIAKYLITSRDYEHTYKLAVTDGLTDMFNHRYFQEQMRANIQTAKRYGGVFSLIIIDIDFFKKFNDTYGHQSGDAVLRQVAQTIKKNIRSTDIACRYGGEEMSVILTNTSKEDAIKTAVKICEAVRNRKFELATGDHTNVTISLGVASMPQDGDTTEKLIAYADKCLYIAKGNGRNQVIFEAPEDTPTGN